MKEKRIIAMFITSAIALVVSLVVTFGIVLTLADPVEATGLTRYAINYGGTNDSLIAKSGENYTLASDVIYTPSGSIIWKDKPAASDINDDEFIVDAQPDAAGKFDYSTVVRYGNESYSSKVKVIPFRVKNDTAAKKSFEIKITATGDETLLAYTGAKLFEYSNPTTFVSKALNNNLPLCEIEAGEYADFLLVIYTDESANLGEGIAFGSARLNLNIVIG